MTDKPSPSDLARVDLLDACLSHVPFEGWTVKSMRLAVKDCGLPQGAEELYFPGGPLELIRFWSEQCDNEAREILSRKGLGNMRIRDKVTEAVLVRLQVLGRHEEAARRAMARLSLPDALGQAGQHLWASADMIWRAIGDTSTDGNYYSKRAILSGVIGTTLVSWLADDTDDKSKARTFLDARIANVMQFEKIKWDVRKRMNDLPEPAELLGRLRYGRRRRRRR